MTESARRANGDGGRREGGPFAPAVDAIRRRVEEEVRERPVLAMATAIGVGALLAFAPQRFVGAAVAAGARMALARSTLGAIDLRRLFFGDPDRS